MNYTRRDLSLLLPALAAASSSSAQTKTAKLPSHSFRFEDLKTKTNGDNRSWDVFDGLTHSGFHIDMHITELAPGKMPHPAHHHEHEEMIMLKEGTLEVTILDKKTVIGPGSVTYVASNEDHGWRNIGDTKATYFVLALGRAQKA